MRSYPVLLKLVSRQTDVTLSQTLHKFQSLIITVNSLLTNAIGPMVTVFSNNPTDLPSSELEPPVDLDFIEPL